MEVGGAEVLVASLCRLQWLDSCASSVYCLYRLGALGEQLRAEGIPVRLLEPGGSARKMAELHRLFRQDGIEAAHFHNAQATILGAAAAKLAGVRRSISTRHGLVPPPYLWRREIQYAAACFFVDAIVAVCRKAEANLHGIGGLPGRKIHTIYNGCLPAPKSLEAGLFREASTWKVLQVGRLSPPKDPECLIEAAGLLREEIPGLEVVFVGDGPLQGPMEQLVRAKGLEATVRFAGASANVGDWLSEADQFVLATRSEGMPLSILEAMEAGLQVAAADTGGIAEMLPLGGLSALYRQGDAEDLAAAIRTAWQAREQKERRREAIRAHFTARFTLEKMASEYRRLYEG